MVLQQPGSLAGRHGDSPPVLGKDMKEEDTGTVPCLKGKRMSEIEYCFMCHRLEKDVPALIRIPGNMCVCTDCMQKTFDMAEDMNFSPDMFGSMGWTQPTTATKADEDEQCGTVGSTGVRREMPETIDVDENLNAGKEAENAGKKDDEPLEEKTEDNDEGKDNGPFRFGGNGFPNISFLNINDLFGAAPGRQKPKKEKKPLEPIDLKNILPPHKIKEKLDEYVIGQEQAKKIISVAVYNHYKRVATGTMDEIEIEKSNILMIGPTGSGKTYLVKTLAKLLDVPLAIADATSLTEAGYIGDDIESVVSKLLAAADNDVERAERGIIFVDEIDKLARKKNTTSRDVSGESVQQGMLKLLEGAEIEVPIGASSKNAMVPLTTVNTRNILFICGGAFPDLEEIIKQRLNKQTSIGYTAELKDKWDKEKNILSKVTVEDIKKFGMIPEFVGRLPIICTLEGLTEESLIAILKEPKNAILKQYQKLLNLDEVDLQFTDEALEAIAKKAIEKDTGARALRAIIEEFMLDIMYEIPKDPNIGRVTITKEYIEGTGGPVVITRSAVE